MKNKSKLLELHMKIISKHIQDHKKYRMLIKQRKDKFLPKLNKFMKPIKMIKSTEDSKNHLLLKWTNLAS